MGAPGVMPSQMGMGIGMGGMHHMGGVNPMMMGGAGVGAGARPVVAPQQTHSSLGTSFMNAAVQGQKGSVFDPQPQAKPSVGNDKFTDLRW